jgi:hypothetical protein
MLSSLRNVVKALAISLCSTIAQADESPQLERAIDLRNKVIEQFAKAYHRASSNCQTDYKSFQDKEKCLVAVSDTIRLFSKGVSIDLRYQYENLSATQERLRGLTAAGIIKLRIDCKYSRVRFSKLIEQNNGCLAALSHIYYREVNPSDIDSEDGHAKILKQMSAHLTTLPPMIYSAN